MADKNSQVFKGIKPYIAAMVDDTVSRRIKPPPVPVSMPNQFSALTIGSLTVGKIWFPENSTTSGTGLYADQVTPPISVTVPTGQELSLINLEMTNLQTVQGASQLYGIRLITTGEGIDTGAAINIGNFGRADGIYISAAGKAGAAADNNPSGIGMDVNRSGSGENSNTYGGVGLHIFDWSTTNLGAAGAKMIRLFKIGNPDTGHPAIEIIGNRRAFRVIMPIGGGYTPDAEMIGVYRGDTGEQVWNVQAQGNFFFQQPDLGVFWDFTYPATPGTSIGGLRRNGNYLDIRNAPLAFRIISHDYLNSLIEFNDIGNADFKEGSLIFNRQDTQGINFWYGPTGAIIGRIKKDFLNQYIDIQMPPGGVRILNNGGSAELWRMDNSGHAYHDTGSLFLNGANQGINWFTNPSTVRAAINENGTYLDVRGGTGGFRIVKNDNSASLWEFNDTGNANLKSGNIIFEGIGAYGVNFWYGGVGSTLGRLKKDEAGQTLDVQMPPNGFRVINNGGSAAYAAWDSSGQLTLTRAADGPMLTVGTNTITESGVTYNSGLMRRDGTRVNFTAIHDLVGQVVIGGGIAGDTVRRVVILADGTIQWGAGNATRDVALYRSAADLLKTDDSLMVSLKLGVGIAPASAGIHVERPLVNVYAAVAPAIADSHLVLGNVQASESDNDQSQILFRVYGGTHDRYASIGAVAESAAARTLGLVFTTDNGTNRSERMKLNYLGNLELFQGAFLLEDTTASNAQGITFWYGAAGSGGSIIGRLKKDYTNQFLDIQMPPNGFRVLNYGGSVANAMFTTAGRLGILNTAPEALLHVGAGTDAPGIASTYTAIYATQAGDTNIAVRDSTNNIEAMMYAGSSAVLYGSVTNHPVQIRTNNVAAISIATSGLATFAAGIAFGNETLANYDEGTWTPVLTASVTQPTTLTYTSQTGKYTRIGNMVFFSAYVVVNAFTAGPAAGGLRLSLPFTAAAGGGTECKAIFSGVDLPAGAVGTNLEVYASQAYGEYLVVRDDTTVTSVVITGIAAGDLVGASGFYYV